MERKESDSEEKKESRSPRINRGDEESNSRKAGGSPVESLHGSVGNQTVQRLYDSGAIQAKLEVSSPRDPAEREAERVAKQVVQASQPAVGDDEGERPHRVPGPVTDTSALQRKDANRGSGPGGDREGQIRSLKGGGRSLPNETRSFFEPRLGQDFSDVRIHTGPKADRAARSINAEAFTHGKDVVFRSGKYDPGSKQGKELLAHELTHVVQQRGDTSRTKSAEGVDSQSNGDREGPATTTPRLSSDPVAVESPRHRAARMTVQRQRSGRGKHLESDWAGRAILKRYLTGGGDWVIENNSSWAKYMKDNQRLTAQCRERVLKIAKRVKKKVEKSDDYNENMSIPVNEGPFHAEMQNGESIIGYQYLHGTNANVGGFQISGVATVNSGGGVTNVSLDLNFQWNDVIDPNLQYSTDYYKSLFADIVTLGQNAPYNIEINWRSSPIVQWSGGSPKMRGWPG